MAPGPDHGDVSELLARSMATIGGTAQAGHQPDLGPAADAPNRQQQQQQQQQQAWVGQC
jgi:hypothetical protein